MALANKGSLTSVTNLVQLCVLLTYIVFLGSLLPGPLEKACSVLLHDNKSSDSSPGLRKKQQPHSSSAHQCILRNAYLRSDTSRKLSATSNKPSPREACYDRTILHGTQVHSLFSFMQWKSLHASCRHSSQCVASLAHAHKLNRNRTVCCLLISSSFIVLHKRIPKLAHTISVQVLLECCARHVRFARQHVQHPFNGQWPGKHAYLPHACLQSIHKINSHSCLAP